MRILSQRDKAWRDANLGQSSLTVGRFGCTTTCLSMLSDYFNCYVTPAEIAHNAANYTKDGLVVWKNLKFGKFRFVARDYAEDRAKISEFIKDPDKAVILNVDGGHHWVVALRKSLVGNDWVVADPWNGDKCGAKARYKDVVGAAYFTLK